MLQIFRSNSTFIIFPLLIYAFFIRAWAYLHPIEWIPTNSGLLADWVYEYVSATSWVGITIATLLVVLQGILITLFVNDYKLLPSSNFFPAVFYVLLGSFFPDFLILSPAVFSITFLIISMMSLMGTYRKPNVNKSIFNAGFWIGVSAGFYPPALIFFLVTLVGLAIMRAFKLREYLVLIIGFLLPAYFGYVINFLLELKSGYFDIWHLYNYGFLPIFQGEFSHQELVGFGVFGFVLLWVILNMGEYFSRITIKVQKVLTVVVWLLILPIFSLLFSSGIELDHLLYFVFPLSIFVSYNMDNIKRNGLAEIFHLLLLGALFAGQYYFG